MSITLKNITAADTISSMVDKINFNFDQLILNGGGIEGPRGIEGYPGMQGNPGEQGLRGPQGETGERGVHFHILTLAAVQDAIQYGLGKADPDGDEYEDGDMIIALVPKGDKTTANYTDSIWKVEYRDENTIPPAANGKDFYPSNDYNIVFSQTAHFNEIGTTNKLLHTAPIDNSNKRGLILNDYANRIKLNYSISSQQIDDIIRNNIALVYTEAQSQINSSGSPNCGIVFYKNGEINKPIGSFPRINYVVSLNNNINHLNIASPDQGIRIDAAKDIIISSLENIVISSSAEKTIKLSLKDSEQNENTYLQINDVNSVKQLHFGADEILLGSKVANTAGQWIAIRNTGNSGESSTSCEIELLKNSTFVKSNNIFSIGKSGAETLDVSDLSTYYNQARITIDNAQTTPVLKLIGKEISIGNDFDTESSSGYDEFGCNIKSNKISIYTKHANGKNAGIEINSNDDYKENIHLKTSYPGVTKISNVSEEYSDFLINYNSGINFEQNKFYTDPMGSKLGKSGRYTYGYCNFYQNMKIRNVNNFGAIHAGSVVFNGSYGQASRETETVYDKITYNFVRIGNIVQCHFNGIINTNKICAREYNDRNPDIIHESVAPLSTYGETQFRGNNNIIVSWPTDYTVFRNSLPNYFNIDRDLSGSNSQFNSQFIANRNNLSGLTEESLAKSSFGISTPISAVSLNRIYLGIYPPVIKLTKNGSKFKTNVKNLIGHLTYSTNGSIYEKELSYNDNVSTTLYNGVASNKIPSITISDMEGLYTGKTIAGSNASNSFTLPGSSTRNLIEVDGYFSYILDCTSDDMHKQLGETSSTSTNTYSSISEYSYTGGRMSANEGGNQQDSETIGRSGNIPD